MSVSVSVNGIAYTIPSTGDSNWGSNVTSWIQGISGATLQKNGGTFTLTADADLGGSYGLKGLFKSRTANIAAAGTLRLARADTVSWRNQANGADLALGPGSDNLLEFNSIDVVDVSTAQTLTNKTITGINIKDSTRAYATARRTTSQAISTGTFTVVAFDTTDLDSRSAITGSGTTSWKFTVPAGHAGLYLINTSVILDAGTSGVLAVDVRKNGSTTYPNVARVGRLPASASIMTLSGSVIMSCAAGDYLQVLVFHDAGVNRNINETTNAHCGVQIIRLLSDL